MLHPDVALSLSVAPPTSTVASAVALYLFAAAASVDGVLRGSCGTPSSATGVSARSIITGLFNRKCRFRREQTIADAELYAAFVAIVAIVRSPSRALDDYATTGAALRRPECRR